MAKSVNYDDRLATAISGPVPESALAGVQYRQIIDLLADASPASDEAEAALLRDSHNGRYFSQADFASALIRLSALAKNISPSAQVAALQETRRPLKSVPLIRFLLAQPDAVRDVALGKTCLSGEQWLALLQTLSPQQRADLARRVGLDDPKTIAPDDSVERGEAKNAKDAPENPAFIAAGHKHDSNEELITDAAADTLGAPKTQRTSVVNIGEIVQRIANYTARREAGAAPLLPLAEFAETALPLTQEICFFSDAEGQLTSTDPEIDGIACGLLLFHEAQDAGCGCDRNSAASARHYRPIVNGQYHHRGAPALAGEWRIDAWPRFANEDRSFIGYCGMLTRLADDNDWNNSPAQPDQSACDQTGVSGAIPEQDYRQLLHELRTPAGALKGFAEILQAQLFGPVAAPYRDMAQAIIDDTDNVLSQLARLQS